VKTNKSDFIDAEAIAEAAARPTMRVVPIKTDDQLDLQSLHRIRERSVMRRTAIHQPDSWIVALTWHHSPEGAVPFGCSAAGDSGRCHQQVVGRSTLLLAQLKVELDQFHTPGGGRCTG
jgi:transposase